MRGGKRKRLLQVTPLGLRTARDLGHVREGSGSYRGERKRRWRVLAPSAAAAPASTGVVAAAPIGGAGSARRYRSRSSELFLTRAVSHGALSPAVVLHRRLERPVASFVPSARAAIARAFAALGPWARCRIRHPTLPPATHADSLTLLVLRSRLRQSFGVSRSQRLILRPIGADHPDRVVRVHPASRNSIGINWDTRTSSKYTPDRAGCRSGVAV